MAGSKAYQARAPDRDTGITTEYSMPQEHYSMGVAAYDQQFYNSRL